MASVSSYVQQMSQSTGLSNKTIQQIVKELGGTTNVAKDNYNAADKIDVTDPRLRTIEEYLNELGAQGYQYKQDDILAALNQASEAGHTARQNELTAAQAAYNRTLAANQATAADTIRDQYAQAIQTGMTKGMQNANMLSTLLGTSQQAAEGAQSLAEQRVQAAKEYAAELASNGVSALDKSTNAYNTLLGNIRQLYNDEIQEKTADLEYNASLEETLANYLANKYTADTNYANTINTAAANMFGANQSAMSNLGSAAAGAAAQDNYSDAYRAAQQALADANIQAAQIAANAQIQAAAKSAAAYSSGYSTGSGTGTSTSAGTNKTTTTTKKANTGSGYLTGAIAGLKKTNTPNINNVADLVAGKTGQNVLKKK